MGQQQVTQEIQKHFTGKVLVGTCRRY